MLFHFRCSTRLPLRIRSSPGAVGRSPPVVVISWTQSEKWLELRASCRSVVNCTGQVSLSVFLSLSPTVTQATARPLGKFVGGVYVPRLPLAAAALYSASARAFDSASQEMWRTDGRTDMLLLLITTKMMMTSLWRHQLPRLSANRWSARISDWNHLTMDSLQFKIVLMSSEHKSNVIRFNVFMRRPP